MEPTAIINVEENERTNANLHLQADILQNIPAITWTVTPDGQLEFINRFFLEVTGQTLEACTAPHAVWNRGGSDLPPFLAGLHPDHRERVGKIFWNGIRSGQGWMFEAPYFHYREGRYHWHLDRAVPVYGTRGELLRFVGTCVDIDELKQAEEENKALLEVSNALNGALAYRPLSAHFSSSRSFTVFSVVCKALRRVILLDWAELALYEPQTDLLRVLATVGRQNQDDLDAGRELAREATVSAWSSILAFLFFEPIFNGNSNIPMSAD